MQRRVYPSAAPRREARPELPIKAPRKMPAAAQHAPAVGGGVRGWAFFRELLGPPRDDSSEPSAHRPSPRARSGNSSRRPPQLGLGPCARENRQQSKSGQSFGCARRLGGRRGAVEAGNRRRIGVGGASADLSVAADVGGFCVAMDWQTQTPGIVLLPTNLQLAGLHGRLFAASLRPKAEGAASAGF